ncbi:leucine-rich repeat protein [Mycoplasma sp. VS299A]|uniref:leucine-rich repeat domain-containing protein n=1 Tax=Mycoplasma sp. VS299A TaxID=3401690 RepID=UPI003AAFACAC
MKKHKLFKLLTIISATSTLVIPFTAGSCDNKNENKKPTIGPKEQPGDKNKNIYSFLYNYGNEKTQVKYNKNENRLLIEDAQDITSDMFEEILNKLWRKGIRPTFLTLDCPNAKTIFFNYANSVIIKELNLPKIENVIGDPHYETSRSLNNFLEDDKVIQNGILFKWRNASGDIEDKSVRKIIRNAFDNTDNITSVSFPNVQYIDPKAFYSFNNELFPLLKENKLVINGFLAKWKDARGAIIDNNITSIGADVFSNNDDITSVSFPSVTRIGSVTFAGASNLTSVDMPNLQDIGFLAFEDTPKLTGKIILNGILTKWDNASGDIADDSITSIADGVFENNTNITSVSFPNVTRIGSETFAGATNLTSVSFPNVTSIGDRAFDGATNLTSVSFPNVTSIGYNAFDNTPKLTSKIVVNGKLIKWGDASGDIVDDTITSIDDGVFWNNTNITSVSFPNVTRIGFDTFADASNLTSVDMPNLQGIRFRAFKNTPKLTGKIILNGILTKWDNASGDIADDSITSIADGVFENNTNITSVSFPNVTSIGDRAFDGATNLTSVSFPNVTSIGDRAFEGATNLTSVDMPNLQGIGFRAFKNTPELTGKIILNGILAKWDNVSGDIADDNITSIADGVFENNTNISSVSFPNVTSIGDRAFKDATNLTSVSFPNVTSIGYNAFDNTPKLTSKIVVNGKLIKWGDASGDIVDDTITSIADGVFENNTNITSVSFPNVTAIGDSAFNGATNLSSADFPNVTSIGDRAFKDATNLTSVNMPKLKNVGYNAFQNTPKLTSKIVVNGKLIRWSGASGDIVDDTITSIADGVFENNTNISSVSFPNVRSIRYRAFAGASNLTSVDTPNLQDIRFLAFKNTPKLTGKIILNGILTKWDNASGDIADDSITSIADGVFWNNTNITSVSFPNVTRIGSETFAGATNLTSVSIPNVTYIGDYAFDSARNLEILNVPKLEYLGKEALRNTPKLVEKPNIKQKN